MGINILSQVTSDQLHQMTAVLFDEMDLTELKIEDFDEFFHALVHIDPKLFVVEVEGLNNPYLKIIKIMKKSILTREVPILVLVSDPDPELLDEITQLDVQGILQPPFHKNLLRFNVTQLLEIGKRNELIQSNQDLKTVQSVMISGLASLAEYRDPETGEHIKRTQNYVKALATTLFRQEKFQDELTMETIEAMYMAVPLHDIGKVGIRDEILLKPGRLTQDEFEIMKDHASLGYEAIMGVGNRLKNSLFLEYAADVAYTHHEKYDGSGYPRGIVGSKIPLIGRLMAVADVYDALTSKRVYKDAMSHEEAMEIITAEKGKHFDPTIVDCLVHLDVTFRNISHTYKDTRDHLDQNLHLYDLLNDKLLKKILVVEDSRIVREITYNQLKSIGFDVTVANDGLEGLEKIKYHKYDMVLLDLEMPRMNGYEMAVEVKKMDEPPIIISMTAADYNTTPKKLKTIGISGLVLKPLDLDRLAVLYREAYSLRNK